MAYDDVLAERLRERLEDEVAVTEKRMFGGLSFLVGVPVRIVSPAANERIRSGLAGRPAAGVTSAGGARAGSR